MASLDRAGGSAAAAVGAGAAGTGAAAFAWICCAFRSTAFAVASRLRISVCFSCFRARRPCTNASRALLALARSRSATRAAPSEASSRRRCETSSLCTRASRAPRGGRGRDDAAALIGEPGERVELRERVVEGLRSEDDRERVRPAVLVEAAQVVGELPLRDRERSPGRSDLSRQPRLPFPQARRAGLERCDLSVRAAEAGFERVEVEQSLVRAGVEQLGCDLQLLRLLAISRARTGCRSGRADGERQHPDEACEPGRGSCPPAAHGRVTVPQSPLPPVDFVRPRTRLREGVQARDAACLRRFSGCGYPGGLLTSFTCDVPEPSGAAS